jgi:hypothetical protein
MDQSEKEYLLARAEQEREQASRTTDELARSIHLKLAYEYSVRANGSGTPPAAGDAVFGGSTSGLKLL